MDLNLFSTNPFFQSPEYFFCQIRETKHAAGAYLLGRRGRFHRKWELSVHGRPHGGGGDGFNGRDTEAAHEGEEIGAAAAGEGSAGGPGRGQPFVSQELRLRD